MTALRRIVQGSGRSLQAKDAGDSEAKKVRKDRKQK